HGLRYSQSCTQHVHTPVQHRAECVLPWQTLKKITGNGTRSTPSKVATTLWTRMPQKLWPKKPSMRYSTLKKWVCRSTVRQKVKSTSVASVATPAITVNHRYVAPAMQQTAPAT